MKIVFFLITCWFASKSVYSGASSLKVNGLALALGLALGLGRAMPRLAAGSLASETLVAAAPLSLGQPVGLLRDRAPPPRVHVPHLVLPLRRAEDAVGARTARVAHGRAA